MRREEQDVTTVAASIASPIVRTLGRVPFEATWRAMRDFNLARGPETPDEIWLLEHDPVFTLGLAGRREHVLDPGDIPVVACDRGGQVTYHGPGQAVAYVLLDLRRLGLGAKELVRRLEEAAIDVLAQYGIRGERRAGMPGVYVGGAKIAAVGLRVARGCSYHGLALNADMDLAVYRRIDPCGYPGLASTRLADHGVTDRIDAVQQKLTASLLRAVNPGPGQLAIRGKFRRVQSDD
jgi:lipoyl(octanoyl) transferase